MHRRARHLNPKSAGATMALDARYMTGFSDGDAVATWSDRPGGTAYDVTQSDSAKRPLYKTAIQGGQPLVRFDGSNDVLEKASVTNTDVQSWVAVMIPRDFAGTYNSFWTNEDSSATAGLARLFKSNGKSALYPLTTGQTVFFDGTGAITYATGTAYIDSVTSSAGVKAKAWSNGKLDGETNNNVVAWSTTQTLRIASSPVANREWQVDIGAVAMFLGTSISDSLRRRLEQAAAYSFKILCG